MSTHESKFMSSPIPVEEIENVLEWVDTYKLSRNTKKINRDFADAVLLAEILYQHYPKLVEMHNYPPRHAQSMRMYNWTTLDKKVLKKLKLNLTPKTIEQLSNGQQGVIERVLLMVRDKIRKDEELARERMQQEQSSSGGSYYEATSGNEQVLVVPVKQRVNGILQLMEKKVVTHESYTNLKEELTEAKEAIETLKVKVEHMESVLKLKDERIDQLQLQLERKASRKKIEDITQNEEIEIFHANVNTLVNPTPKASVIEMKQHSSIVEVKSPSSGFDTSTKSAMIDIKASIQSTIESNDKKSLSRMSSNISTQLQGLSMADGPGGEAVRMKNSEGSKCYIDDGSPKALHSVEGNLDVVAELRNQINVNNLRLTRNVGKIARTGELSKASEKNPQQSIDELLTLANELKSQHAAQNKAESKPDGSPLKSEGRVLDDFLKNKVDAIAKSLDIELKPKFSVVEN